MTTATTKRPLALADAPVTSDEVAQFLDMIAAGYRCPADDDVQVFYQPAMAYVLRNAERIARALQAALNLAWIAPEARE